MTVRWSIHDRPMIVLKIVSNHQFFAPLLPAVTIAQFIWILRQRLKLSKNKAIYLFVNKTLPQSSALIGEIYSQHQDEDGFVYCK